MPEKQVSQQGSEPQGASQDAPSATVVTTEFTLKSGVSAMLVYPSPVLHVRFHIDPEEASSFDDKFKLESTDGTYQKSLTVVDDQIPGDRYVDLIFDNLKRKLSYTLTVDPGAEGKPYTVFEDVPFTELVEHYGILEEGDDLEDADHEEAEEAGDDTSASELDWDDEEDGGTEWGGDPEDLDEELDNWTDDEYEDTGGDDEWVAG